MQMSEAYRCNKIITFAFKLKASCEQTILFCVDCLSLVGLRRLASCSISHFFMSYLIPLHNYRPLLDMNATEQGIKVIKEFFADNLSTALRLRRVTAPLFVLRGLGINDDLSGKERAVNFPIKDLGDARAEVVHSLAKWKRLTLAEYDVQPGYGIYTDMNAIRADEELGNIHSLYVDQWDWERVIRPEDRTVEFLEEVVRSIYAAMQRTEYLVCERFPQLQPQLSAEITFIHAEALRQLYPTRFERRPARVEQCARPCF